MSAQAVTFANFSTPPLPARPPEPAEWKTLSDEELVAVYRENWETNRDTQAREDAAAELFARHQARITRWCWRFTHDRESACDLAQEILLRAFRNLDSYRGECRFSTWLYVIARNLCMSAIHKRSNEPVWVVKASGMDFPDTAAVDIHMAVETEQTRSRSWRFILDTLDKTEARVMMLHYGQEMPLNAVSRMLGLTNKSGAKAYIVSARRKLQAAMSTTRLTAARPIADLRKSA
jgi:RNA polymerase sigma-70 factor, ECF subfamily